MNTFINKQTAVIYAAIMSTDTAEYFVRKYLRKGFYGNIIEMLRKDNLITKACDFEQVDWFAIHKAFFEPKPDAPFLVKAGQKQAIEQYFGVQYEQYKFNVGADRIMYR